jgi:hypothetical protein
MNTKRLAIALAVASALCASAGYAQTPAPSQSTTTPSSASSPSQREATGNKASESTSPPADASTPHQQKATKIATAEDKTSHDQMMKDCMDKQAARNNTMSKSGMTKACEDQLKTQKDQSGKLKAPTDASSDHATPDSAK